MLRHFLFLIFFLCFFQVSVDALGLTPGKTVFDFKANSIAEGTITLFNTDNTDLLLDIYPEGELAPYISLSEQQISIAKGESKTITYTLHFPETFDRAGVFTTPIIIKPHLSSKKDGKPGDVQLHALNGVASGVEVRVPYSGKTLEASIIIPPTESFAPVSFIAHIQNVGDNNIRSVNMRVALYDTEGQFLTTVSSEQQPLKTNARGTFVATWDPHVAYGEYHAVITLTYDGREQELTTDFIVGKPLLEMTDVSIDHFVFGSEATIVLTLQQTGEKPLTATGSLQLTDEQEKSIASFDEQSLLLDSNTPGELRYVWSLNEIPIGRYTGTVTLQAQEFTLHRTFHILLTEDGISASFTPLNSLTGKTISLEPHQGSSTSSFTRATLLIILLIIAVNLFVFFFYRRRRRQKPQTSPSESFL